MSILKWESFLETKIEGFFNKKFASDLQVVEIEKALRREILLKKKRLQGDIYAPNVYSIYTSEVDYQRICSQKTQNQLYEAAVIAVIEQNFMIDGKLSMMLKKDTTLKKGSCHIQSCYTSECVNVESKTSEEPHTLVLERSNFKDSMDLPIEHKFAALTVEQGPDINSYLEIGEKRIHIGRREENEFLLMDVNSSRLHAYISFEKYRHILYDAGSLNGTYVNAQKVTCQRLCFGDEIKIGNTVLLYEVI
ncbi:FhaA domain-containing protein [Propionispira raffinosivorans]|uniref:FhaA domain-containing protein n=1 Tax=Propionispira raffinosivorans TaxID=86959 RepID=UPI00037BF025|nr:FhaA domain-containing protein [Propionispira raffinosivorans]